MKKMKNFLDKYAVGTNSVSLVNFLSPKEKNERFFFFSDSIIDELMEDLDFKLESNTLKNLLKTDIFLLLEILKNLYLITTPILDNFLNKAIIRQKWERKIKYWLRKRSWPICYLPSLECLYYYYLSAKQKKIKISFNFISIQNCFWLNSIFFYYNYWIHHKLKEHRKDKPRCVYKEIFALFFQLKTNPKKKILSFKTGFLNNSNNNNIIEYGSYNFVNMVPNFLYLFDFSIFYEDELLWKKVELISNLFLKEDKINFSEDLFFYSCWKIR